MIGKGENHPNRKPLHDLKKILKHKNILVKLTMAIFNLKKKEKAKCKSHQNRIPLRLFSASFQISFKDGKEKKVNGKIKVIQGAPF